jgi:hypothetical protein
MRKLKRDDLWEITMELWAHAHGYLALWRAARFTYRKTNSGSSFTVPFGGCCVELHANLSRRAALTLYATVVPLFLFGFIATTLAHAQEQGHKESSFSVRVAVRAFVDEGRSNWQGTGPRPLTTIIWYPAASGSKLKAPDFGAPQIQKYFVSYPLAADAAISAERQKYPLVVLSHGNTSLALSLDWLGYYLASHGYVVAAVNHHGNTAAEQMGLFLRDSGQNGCAPEISQS